MKILLQNLTKKFPGRGKKSPEEVIAVNDFTFEIPDGKLIGLLGPSGCGKSTREEIRRIQRQTGVTTVFVTHDQEEAMSISDMIVVMKEGVVQQIGKPQEVYDQPVNLFVAKFLGTPPINVFRGKVSGGRLYIGSEAVLSLSDVPDQEVTLSIRPEGFILREDGPLTCDLTRVEVMGRDVSVVSTHPCSENLSIRSIINAENTVDPDAEKVRFALKPRKLYLFHPRTGERIPFTAE